MLQKKERNLTFGGLWEGKYYFKCDVLTKEGVN